MLLPNAFNQLSYCEANGITKIPAPNYNYRAEQILWHLRHTVGFDQWVWGDYSVKFGEEYHLVGEIITWQEELYVSNLMSLCQLSDTDLLLNILYDDPNNYEVSAPRVVVYGNYKVLADGNHRWWHLANRGIVDAVFKTIYFEDQGDLDWNAPPNIDYDWNVKT